MTSGEFLEQATSTLRHAGIDTPRLDVLVLLEDALRKDRAQLLAHPEIKLLPAQISILNTKVAQRRQHIPLAYIRGQAAFYGRDFIVTPATLVPRPESEAMIDLLIKQSLPDIPSIADIGTGSGCLGITACLQIPAAMVFVYDSSATALQIAADNAHRHNVRIRADVQDLLTGDRRHYDVVLANLPYVPDHFPINQAASHEPAEALFSGSDGLAHYLRLWQQIKRRPSGQKPEHVITESLPQQHKALAHIARAAGYALHETLGYAQHFMRI